MSMINQKSATDCYSHQSVMGQQR